jgi:hypothetical protein
MNCVSSVSLAFKTMAGQFSLPGLHFFQEGYANTNSIAIPGPGGNCV